jgi:hypothetical protein
MSYVSTDDEEYERKRADADRVADLAAQFDPALADPVPAGWDGDRDVDQDKVWRLILAGAPPDAEEELRAGRLRWSLAGFDENGRGWVSVIRADTGEEIGGARVHWSAVAR